MGARTSSGSAWVPAATGIVAAAIRVAASGAWPGSAPRNSLLTRSVRPAAVFSAPFIKPVASCTPGRLVMAFTPRSSSDGCCGTNPGGGGGAENPCGGGGELAALFAGTKPGGGGGVTALEPIGYSLAALLLLSADSRVPGPPDSWPVAVAVVQAALPAVVAAAVVALQLQGHSPSRRIACEGNGCYRPSPGAGLREPG